MAIALPVYEANAEAHDSLALPVFVTAAEDPDSLKLPAYVAAAEAPASLKLPTWLLTENIPSTLTVVPAGGVVLGGASFIGNDPWFPDGGVTLGGAATVSEIIVLRFEMYAYGGVTLGGAATVATGWSTFVPAGGVAIGGAATVSGVTILHYEIPAPEGGVQLGGSADVITMPDGGIVLGGAAEVVVIYPLTHTPAGGIVLGGAAAVSAVAVIVPTGGIVMGGSAETSAIFPVFVPTGGVQIGGAAVMYAVPAGATYTAENPHYSPYPGWALNADTNGVSRYKGVVANSFCQLAGKTYLANAAGIYEADGIDDAGLPIAAKLVMPKDDLGSSMNRRVAYVWLGVRSTGRLKLGVKTNDQDAWYYSVDHSDVDGARGSRVKLGKGLNGRYWQFSIENDEGADFDISAFEYEPAISTTRRGR